MKIGKFSKHDFRCNRDPEPGVNGARRCSPSFGERLEEVAVLEPQMPPPVALSKTAEDYAPDFRPRSLCTMNLSVFSRVRLSWPAHKERLAAQRTWSSFPRRVCFCLSLSRRQMAWCRRRCDLEGSRCAYRRFQQGRRAAMARALRYEFASRAPHIFALLSARMPSLGHRTCPLECLARQWLCISGRIGASLFYVLLHRCHGSTRGSNHRK